MLCGQLMMARVFNVGLSLNLDMAKLIFFGKVLKFITIFSFDRNDSVQLVVEKEKKI